jgi:hypothetical protein
VFQFQGRGFRVEGVGCEVKNLRPDSGCGVVVGVYGEGHETIGVQGLGFTVDGLGFRI